MTQPLPLIRRVVVLSTLAMAADTRAAAPTDYSFITGADLRDALSQQSMVLSGYLLGVADALKHSADPARCFVIPNAADADVRLHTAYLDHWDPSQTPPDDAVQAITEAFSAHFPCAPQ
ncbi:hypothetical protein GH975_06205 [Litorivicinus lipolyticus]|uniref:Rap1a immunity protein domain-containing protein n=1 Tax=Litorivicinus lipolyticus TaxID=418701 RepID=A0A5Q2Q7Z0_9GAMM|nr:hypothetical protein [Litorivicinus lipolyticus]QGG80188.1 hypothetical protein GH975_06205 [Litorivicinus lipolyticus]